MADPNIKVYSHESFPEDQYTKELVYLLIDDLYKIAYVKKQAKNGGMFWGPVSAGVSKNNKKEYRDGFKQDSKTVDDFIKNLLEKRVWENAPVRPREDDNIPF